MGVAPAGWSQHACPVVGQGVAPTGVYRVGWEGGHCRELGAAPVRWDGARGHSRGLSDFAPLGWERATAGVITSRAGWDMGVAPMQ